MTAPFTPDQEARIREMIAETLEAGDKATMMSIRDVIADQLRQINGNMKTLNKTFFDGIAKSLSEIAGIERAREKRVEDAADLSEAFPPRTEKEESH